MYWPQSRRPERPWVLAFRGPRRRAADPGATGGCPPVIKTRGRRRGRRGKPPGDRERGGRPRGPGGQAKGADVPVRRLKDFTETSQSL